MPILEASYRPPFWAKNGHVSTMYAGLLRRAPKVQQTRERLRLPDGDFMDLDWSYAAESTDKLIILLHGLEGSAQRPYITASAQLFNTNGYDALAVNFRSCSGEPNALFRSYHSGATEDLQAVLDHVLNTTSYQSIVIKGVSLGGNLVLKYLGEGNQLPQELKAVLAVSVPCHLKGSCEQLHTLKNKLYAARFLKHLKAKLWTKVQQFPEQISPKEFESIKTLLDFDHVYTAKAHGFADAYDYYKRSSSLQFLPNITVPTLIINALNDSFLSPECFPVREAKHNDMLFLEMPKYGGHVGFVANSPYYYNDTRGLAFVSNYL